MSQFNKFYTEYYIILDERHSNTLYRIQYYKQFLHHMQLASQIDKTLAKKLPLYGNASKYAQNQYKRTLQTLSNIYATSDAQVKKVKKTTKGFKNQAFLLCSQSADDLLEFVQDKLNIEIGELQEKDKANRVIKILNHLKEELIMNPVHKVAQFNGALIEKGKQLNGKYILPLYITFKATVLVSRQIMMEVLAEKLGQLKMTYKISKDGITMFFTGEFDQEKILARVGSNINSFKHFTINFVQKGMEIRISKRDLLENYHTVVDKLSQIVHGVSNKSLEQWNETKSKTINLYHSVLNRIKEKEIEIRTQYIQNPTEAEIYDQHVPTQEASQPIELQELHKLNEGATINTEADPKTQ